LYSTTGEKMRNFYFPLYLFSAKTSCRGIQIDQTTADFSGLFRKPNLMPTATHISTTHRKEKERKIFVHTEREREKKDGMICR
jgi:hypothetical protein